MGAVRLRLDQLVTHPPRKQLLSLLKFAGDAAWFTYNKVYSIITLSLRELNVVALLSPDEKVYSDVVHMMLSRIWEEQNAEFRLVDLSIRSLRPTNPVITLVRPKSLVTLPTSFPSLKDDATVRGHQCSPISNAVAP